MRSGAIRRFGSYFIDDLFLSIFEFIIMAFSWRAIISLIELSEDLEVGLLTFNEYMKEYWSVFGPIQLTAVIVISVLSVCYMIILPYYWDGKTIGRNLVGVKLQSIDGSKLTIGKLFLREFVFKVLWWIVTLGIGAVIDFIMIAVREDKFAIRDIVTKTEIIDAEGESVKEEYYDF